PIVAIAAGKSSIAGALRDPRKPQRQRVPARQPGQWRQYRAKPVEKFLWTGNANSTQGRAGRRRDRFAVERAAGPGARSEKLVERRRDDAGSDGPVPVDDRGGARPIRLSSDISAGAVDRIDHPDVARREPPAVLGAFLREPGESVIERAQTLAQQSVDGDVGFAD